MHFADDGPDFVDEIFLFALRTAVEFDAARRPTGAVGASQVERVLAFQVVAFAYLNSNETI